MSSRSILLPVILTLSLFLVFLGMRAPHFHKNEKPRLQYRAEIESPIKASQAGIEKQAQVLDSCLCTGLAAPPSFQVSSFHTEELNCDPLVVSAISARASPVAGT